MSKFLGNRRIRTFLIFGLVGLRAMAQLPEDTEWNKYNSTYRTPEPFLFSVTTLTREDLKWSVHYSGSYGERVESPFGYEGVSQQIAVKGYLGKQFTVYANAGMGIPHDGKITSMQQVEVIHDFICGEKYKGLRLGIGLGVSNDFSNAKSLLSRVTASYNVSRLKASGNVLFEHTFLDNRDAVDVIMNLGLQYCLIGNLYGGIETVGQDLEGFWDKEEAEGGARLLVGPSLNLAPKRSRFSFSLCGGPVIQATTSQITNQYAIRELPTQSGFILMGRVIYNLSDI